MMTEEEYRFVYNRVNELESEIESVAKAAADACENGQPRDGLLARYEALVAKHKALMPRLLEGANERTVTP